VRTQSTASSPGALEMDGDIPHFLSKRGQPF
jgi:hypothetical protein